MFQACVLWNLLYFKLLLSVVLYLRLSGQFWVFFCEKILSRKKVPKCKTNEFHPFVSFCAWKIVAFVVFCLLNFVLLVVFYLVCTFVLQKSFREKINRPKIILMTSNTILLKSTPLNHPMKNLFVCTYFYLWESLFILACENISSMIISENLFKAFLFVRISSYLCLSVKNLFLFVLICEILK